MGLSAAYTNSNTVTSFCNKKCRVCLRPLTYLNSRRRKSSYCKSCYNERERRKYKEVGKYKYRETYITSPEMFIVNSANQRAKKLGATGKITVEQWIELRESYLNRCAYCCIAGVKLHIEHFWPLSLVGKNLDISHLATNTIENIAPACEFCNRAKQDKPFLMFLGWKNGTLDFTLPEQNFIL